MSTAAAWAKARKLGQLGPNEGEFDVGFTMRTFTHQLALWRGLCRPSLNKAMYLYCYEMSQIGILVDVY